MPTKENQPDILDPSRTRPEKPASPATVPMPGRSATEEEKQPSEREPEERQRPPR